MVLHKGPDAVVYDPVACWDRLHSNASRLFVDQGGSLELITLPMNKSSK